MRFANSILLLATASVAFAFDAVISKGLWVGIDSTELGASVEEIFANRRNHVTATSSLLQFYGADTSYVPWETTPEKGRYSYGEFKFSVENTPAFKKIETSTALVYVSGDLDELQEAIRQEYKHQDRQLVALNLASSIPTKSRNLGGTQQVLFSLVEIFKPRTQKAVHVRLIELPLMLRTDEGNVRVLEQDAELVVLTFEVNTKWLQDHAQELSSEFIQVATPVKEFVQIFTTFAEDEDEDEDEDEEYVSQWVSSNRRLYRNFPIAF
ncbi:hypothetical protein DFQ26_004644 [Actinomortierella ambigua]|nr:hypothetical protein DFQ26_004644 [Actinomortierella ambigua]